MRRFSIIILSVVIATFFLVPTFFFSTALAAPPPPPRDYGLEATAGEARLAKPGLTDIQVLIGKVIGAALSMIGVLFFILTLYGGILWMTAHGNEEQTKKAKDAIIAAVVGMIIVVAAYALTRFVFTSVWTGGGASGGAPGGAGDQRCAIKSGAPAYCATFNCGAVEPLQQCSTGIASSACCELIPAALEGCIVRPEASDPRNASICASGPAACGSLASEKRCKGNDGDQRDPVTGLRPLFYDLCCQWR